MAATCTLCIIRKGVYYFIMRKYTTSGVSDPEDDVLRVMMCSGLMIGLYKICQKKLGVHRKKLHQLDLDPEKRPQIKPSKRLLMSMLIGPTNDDSN